MNKSVESIPNVKLTTIINHSEENNDLFLAGYSSLLVNSDSRAARDFYLLLIVYVNYFCVPVFSFVFKSLCALRSSIRCKLSEITRVADMAITFLMVDKKYITLLPFSRTKQVEYNLLSSNIYRRTVLL
jgi:hypothetical protein